MAGLCKKAGVKYLRFHALRNAGAAVMETNHGPIESIQSILGHETEQQLNLSTQYREVRTGGDCGS
jgi:integrase